MSPYTLTPSYPHSTHISPSAHNHVALAITVAVAFASAIFIVPLSLERKAVVLAIK